MYVIKLELEGYRDTTFSITITANQTGVVNVTLKEVRTYNEGVNW